jgi:hypothetical protein
VPFFFVNADDFDFHFLPDFQYVAGMADLVPGDFRHMHQAVSAVDVHKRAKISQAGHAPLGLRPSAFRSLYRGWSRGS